MRKSCFYLLLAACLLFTPPLKPAPQDSSAVQAFEKFAGIQMASDKLPGLAIGFFKDDFTWMKGFGFADLENRVPVKTESAFRLASITKTFTALAVMQLVEAGKIDLDAEVQTYVPHFPKKRWRVTPRMLLGHLGGISHYRDYEREGHIKEHKDTREALALFQDFPLVAKPGTRYHYSSYGYNLLGAVIEGASEESFGDYIQDHILLPLEMSDTRLDDPSDLIPNRVRGYRLVKGVAKNSEFIDVSSRFAGGGLRSTVADLLKYARGICRGDLLERDTWDLMFSSMATADGRFTGYGMGWHVRPWRGHFQVSHGGSQAETRTYLTIFPSENFAIAAALNLEGANPLVYVTRLAELVLDEDLDSRAYLPDQREQAVYDACDQVFRYGMSFYDRMGEVPIEDAEDLDIAFAVFNRRVRLAPLKRSYVKAKTSIDNGIHPMSRQAFIKVGAFMASTLENTLGTGSLARYHTGGPLEFFSDYIRISGTGRAELKRQRFSSELTALIEKWREIWNEIYSDDLRRLVILPGADADELSRRLKPLFSGASIFPDFSAQIASAATHLTAEEERTIGYALHNLNAELYPLRAGTLSGLAAAHLWRGDPVPAHDLYLQAQRLEPGHRTVSASALKTLATRLGAEGISGMEFALAAITVELHPRDAGLQEWVGDLLLDAGDQEQARLWYLKAFDLDPESESIRKKLDLTRKKDLRNPSES